MFRKTRSGRSRLYLAFGCFTMLGAVGASSASAATLVVDRGEQQCRNADYQSISAAVGAADPGDKIKVCPGLYTETVVVNKPGIRLRAKRTGARSCSSPVAADPARDAIVTGGPQTEAISLQANGIRVRGFVIEGNNVGIRTSGASSGYRIRDVIFQRNDFGLMFGSSGDNRSSVTRSCFRSNGRGQVGGGIFGVAALAGPLRNAAISHNSFFQNTFGIRLGASSDVNVAHNRSLRDGTWMRNGGTVRLRVVHNVVRDAVDAIVFFPLLGAPGGTPNADAVVSHNDLTDNRSDGIQVLANGLVSSLISHNRVGDNGRDGIRIEAGGNSGNLVKHNRLRGNAEHDCHDATQGSGTAGTANVWQQNKGVTENRSGLCSKGKGAKKR